MNLFISMSGRRDALNLRVPYGIARRLLPFVHVASAELCAALGQPGKRFIKLGDIPKAELEDRLRSGVFVQAGRAKFRMYCE